MTPKPPSKVLIVLAFFAIYIIWGTTYLAALWGLEGMEPFVITSLRCLIAAVLLGVWCPIKKYPRPDWVSVKPVAISGIIMIVGGSGLVIAAEKYISSGHAAVVIATEPLWFLLLDRKRWKEYRSNRLVIAGLVIGFIGIALFSYFTPDTHTTNNNELVGTLLTLVAAVFWVVGALYYERSPQQKSHPHVMMTAIQLFGAGVVSALLAAVLGEWTMLDIDAIPDNAWLGFFYLVIMGSIIAYMAFMWLMKVQPPAIVSTYTYVNPIVAVFVGWLLADEKITWLQGIGLVVVLVGILMTRVKSGAENRDAGS